MSSAISSDSPEQQNESTRGSKTYTGCWTCRRRRVKCDETRPICRRCDVGKFICEGYDIKLTWPKQINPSETQSNPASVTPSSEPSQRSSIPAASADPGNKPLIEKSSSTRESGNTVPAKGSFSVFSVHDPVDTETASATSRSIQKLLQEDSSAKSTSQGAQFIAYDPKRTTSSSDRSQTG